MSKECKEVSPVKETKRSELQKFFLSWLLGKSCQDCGETDIRVLELDHKDKVYKISDVSAMMRNPKTTINDFITEINKCEIRCSNCHTKKTRIENNDYRQVYFEEEQTRLKTS
jgi:hypothetical protein